MGNETKIDREKARRILEQAGQANDCDAMDDYYILTDQDGREWLTCWGMDQPMVENNSVVSWHSPGVPA
jgi:hypothetical protein